MGVLWKVIAEWAASANRVASLLALDQIDGQTGPGAIAGSNEFGEPLGTLTSDLDLMFPSVVWATDRPRIAVP